MLKGKPEIARDGVSMSAQMARETRMNDDSRIVKLEAQMGHVLFGVAELKGDVKSLTQEFNSFRIEVATRFGSVDTRLEAVNTSIERVKTLIEGEKTSIEGVKTSVEGVKTLVERNTRWLMGVGVSTLLGVLGHALKWF